MTARTPHTLYLRLLLLVLGALILSGIAFYFRHTQKNVDARISDFHKVFLDRDRLVQEALGDFVAKYERLGDSLLFDKQVLDQLKSEYEKRGLVYLVFDNNGDPVFWSHNALPLEKDHTTDRNSGALRLRNGWYYFRKAEKPEATIYVFAIIKHGFKYQNRFLVNKFFRDFDVSHDVFFLTERSDIGKPVFDTDKQFAFSIQVRRAAALVKTNTILWLLSVGLGIAAYLIFVFASFRYFTSLLRHNHPLLAIAGFTGVMVGFRMVLFMFRAPGVFYDGMLFSPSLYASSWILPSLGDLFLNILMASIICYFLFYHLKTFPGWMSGKRLWVRRISSLLLLAVIYLFCGLAVYLIKGLVINSNLNLNINFIFSIDLYSLVGFLIIGCIFFTFFFVSIVIYRMIEAIIVKRSVLRLMFLIALALILLIHYVFFTFNILHGMLFLSSILVFELERRSSSATPGFTSLVAALFLFSLISTFAIYRYNTRKELENRRSIAMRMASEQDPVAEFLFMEIEQALLNDNQLKTLIQRDPYNEPAIYRYLQHHYFYDFWLKYDMQVTICSPEDMLLVKPQNVEVDCSWFFDDYVRNFGKPTLSRNFIYLDNNTGRNSYLTRIPVVIGDAESPMEMYIIYIEFDSKFVPRDMGFPELLIDQEVDIKPELINYSYATYKGGNLINKYGAYNYSINMAAYGEFDQEFSLFDFDDYHHLIFRKEDDLHIIISRPRETFLEKIAPFSYLFVLFFALVVIFWTLTTHNKVKGFFKLNFKRRLQFSMIGIVIASIVTIGGASTWFIQNIYNNKNISIISEKSHSILVEMEYLLADQEMLDETWELYLSDLLLRVSNIFFTDINLFDPQGILLASSRPRVFEEGLVSSYMNPLAFSTLRTLQKSQYIHSESIGNLEYLSAYVPLRNNESQLLAYINLPYFARQSELRNEVSYFLVAFINIYLLLMVGAILLALFISNYITSPLQLIRDNMAKVQLGRTNQKLQWDRMDEIGSMISEYNRMIDELAVSADLLARSERESAWREMAKQVAHEIKNPLTPMRLSVQYLEKAWKDKDPHWDERLSRFSKTMVEQIDNLTVIAEAFSDFARMPSGINNRVDLRHFIPEVLDLYKDFDKLRISLTMQEGNLPLLIYADRNQLLRVFNNLIKNSIQAYGKDEIVRIDITCHHEASWIITEIKDYGCGIPDSQKSSIFSPYFTTKTGGMGLGLSMVKNIIESFNGRVSFQSKEGQGTAFHLVIPEYKPKEEDIS